MSLSNIAEQLSYLHLNTLEVKHYEIQSRQSIFSVYEFSGGIYRTERDLSDYMSLKEARIEGGYIFSTYFKAFKENFRQSAAAFLIQLVLALVFLFNAHFWGEQNTVLGNALMFVMTALLVVLALTFMYCYPLMARFDNTLTQSMKNAFFVAITHPKFTLGLAGILAVYLFFCFGFSDFAKVFMILLGFSFLAYCNSMLLMKVFQDYEEEPVECILEKE